MAAPTRLYLQNAAPTNTFTVKDSTLTTATNVGKALGTTKAGTSLNVALAIGSVGTNVAKCIIIASATGLAAGPIDGTVKWVIAAHENNAAANLSWHMHIWVSVGSTNVVRGTLLNAYSDSATNEWSQTIQGWANEGPTQALSSVTAVAGDCLVCEIGYIQAGAAANFTGDIDCGATGATDLTQGDTAVTTDPGWIEFSVDLFTTRSAALYPLPQDPGITIPEMAIYRMEEPHGDRQYLHL